MSPPIIPLDSPTTLESCCERNTKSNIAECVCAYECLCVCLEEEGSRINQQQLLVEYTHTYKPTGKGLLSRLAPWCVSLYCNPAGSAQGCCVGHSM